MKLLFNTVTAWEEPPRARHQLAYAYAKQNIEIIFVTKNKTGRRNIGVEDEQKYIKIVEPTFPLDYRIRRRVPILNEIYQNWLYKELTKLYPNLFVINFDPTANRLHKYFKKYLYYCNDEYLHISRVGSKLLLPYVKKAEGRTAKMAKFCVSVSPYLSDKLFQYNKRSYFIPLGALTTEDSSNINFENNNKKSLVYVGSLSENVHWKWLVKASEKFSDYNIFIIGPIYGSSVNQSNFPSLKFLGAKTGKELYQLISNASACLMAYKSDPIEDQTIYVPNKVWLYLSMGKPVISNFYPNMDLQREYVYQSKTEKEFINNIEIAISEDNNKLFNKRKSFAKENTWDKRAQKILELIKNEISKK